MLESTTGGSASSNLPLYLRVLNFHQRPCQPRGYFCLPSRPPHAAQETRALRVPRFGPPLGHSLALLLRGGAHPLPPCAAAYGRHRRMIEAPPLALMHPWEGFARPIIQSIGVVANSKMVVRSPHPGRNLSPDPLRLLPLGSGLQFQFQLPLPILPLGLSLLDSISLRSPANRATPFLL